LGAQKARALLAMLALNLGSPVSTERLIDGLWGEEPPGSAAKMVQGYVSDLRKALAAGGDDDAEIVTRGRSYTLRLGTGDVDARRFERLLAAGAPRDALALWRGPALDDVATQPFAALEIRRLEEQRLAAVELAIEHDLAAGRHPEVVAELEAAVAAEPLRERLHALRMLALYRCGRQAEALEAYRHARDTLVEQAGTEPGAELRRLQAEILRQEPSLDLPTRTNQPTSAAVELPRPPTTLFGREQDVARLRALLCDDATQLVTLVGPGGVGKTRLSLEAALAAADRFERGARFVDLAPVAAAGDVAPAVARAIGAPVRADEPAIAGMRRFIGEASLLLVLDNFEHLLDAAPLVGQLVAVCPALVVMATSRQPLELAAERQYTVEPLELEEAGSPAVAMFLSRARARRPRYASDPEDEQHVREICRRLDGLPLGLELAAARAPLLAPRELAERLAHALDALGRASADAPERHRSLRAALEWSIRLLTDQERRAFARLGAFAGGATVSAAEEIAEVPLDVLDALVAKRLLVRRGERLVMLETVREYAVERLADDPDAAAVRHRLATWCVALLAQATPELAGRRRLARLQELEAEAPNCVSSLDWAIEAEDGELALRIAAELGTFWWRTGRWEEGRPRLDRALDASTDAPPGLRGRVLLMRARLIHRRDWSAFRRDLDEALELLQAAGDRARMALTLDLISYIELAFGQADAAATTASRARELAQACGDDLVLGTVLGGTLAVGTRYEDGAQAARRAVDLLEAADDLVGVGFTCSMVGYQALAERHDQEALEWFEKGADAARRSGDPACQSHVYSNLGLAHLLAGDRDRAAEALAIGLRLALPAAMEHLTDEPLTAMAVVCLQRGDADRAAKLLAAATTHRLVDRMPLEAAVWDRLETELLEPARARSGERWEFTSQPPSLAEAIELAVA
jgi:predicted ATPase/DNA-binding SARP family transcriptional activator